MQQMVGGSEAERGFRARGAEAREKGVGPPPVLAIGPSGAHLRDGEEDLGEHRVREAGEPTALPQLQRERLRRGEELELQGEGEAAAEVEGMQLRRLRGAHLRERERRARRRRQGGVDRPISARRWLR